MSHNVRAVAHKRILRTENYAALVGWIDQMMRFARIQVKLSLRVNFTQLQLSQKVIFKSGSSQLKIH